MPQNESLFFTYPSILHPSIIHPSSLSIIQAATGTVRPTGRWLASSHGFCFSGEPWLIQHVWGLSGLCFRRGWALRRHGSHRGGSEGLAISGEQGLQGHEPRDALAPSPSLAPASSRPHDPCPLPERRSLTFVGQSSPCPVLCARPAATPQLASPAQ